MTLRELRAFRRLLQKGTAYQELVESAFANGLFLRKLEQQNARVLQTQLLRRYLNRLPQSSNYTYYDLGIGLEVLRGCWKTWNETSTAFWRKLANLMSDWELRYSDVPVLEQDTTFFLTDSSCMLSSMSALADHLSLLQPGDNPAFVWATLSHILASCVQFFPHPVTGVLERYEIGSPPYFAYLGVENIVDLITKIDNALTTVYGGEKRPPGLHPAKGRGEDGRLPVKVATKHNFVILQ